MGTPSSSRRGSRTALLFFSLLIARDIHAQTAPQPERKPSDAPTDTLGRTTPRSTVMNFLTAAQKGDYETASRYLNTRKLGTEAAELAEQLFEILDRYLPAKLNQVSDKPEGSLAYPADPDRDLVGTITIGEATLDIVLDRIDRGKAGSIWLFSSNTLAAVPDIHDTISTVRPEVFMPEVLIDTRFVSIPLYQWVAALVGLPLLYLAMGIVSRILSRVAGRILRKLRRTDEVPNPDCLPPPLRLVILALIVRALLAKVALPLLARQFWSQAAITIAVVGSVWFAILINGMAEQRIRLRFGRHDLPWIPGSLSILRFVRRLGDVLVVVIGLLILLHHFGVNVAAAVTGLGIGGIAVALAAQKTLENVIGGVSLIFDQTVRVGDWLKLGDTFGAVEWIGLRSIRIRTLHRTVVSVPNGQVASATLESFSSRDKFWFNHIVGLTYDTNAAQLRAIIAGIVDMLTHHDRVESQSVRVNFLRFGDSSLNVELFAYVLAKEMADFLGVQQELLLRVMETVQRAGAQIAFPSRTLYLANASNSRSETTGDKATVGKPAAAARWRGDRF